MELIIPIMVFVTIVLLALVLAEPQSKSLQKRLRIYGPTAVTEREQHLIQPFHRRVVYPFFRRLGRWIGNLAPQQVRLHLASRLEQAGRSGVWSVLVVLLAKGFLGLLLPAAYLFPILARGQRPGPLQFALALFALYIGTRLPEIWLSRQISLRWQQMEEALPDSLDLLTLCMEAGYGFDAALAKVVEKTRGPLSDEFSRTLQEVTLGKSRGQALRDLSQRAGVAELGSFIAAVVQADQMGMSIANIMRVHSDHMRIRRRQRAEEKAVQAPIKMLFPLIFLVMPALFVVIMGPSVLAAVEYFSRIRGG